MLVFDQQQFEATGVYTLTAPDKAESYTFKDAIAAKLFVDAYYRNLVAAIFAYRVSHEAELAA